MSCGCWCVFGRLVAGIIRISQPSAGMDQVDELALSLSFAANSIYRFFVIE